MMKSIVSTAAPSPHTPASHSWLRAMLACIIAPLILSLPIFWVMDINYDNYDVNFYATAMRLFCDQFWQGDIYPRWLNQANLGLGSPAFVFYNPLLYYLACLIPRSHWDQYGLIHFKLCAVAVCILACFCHRAWLRERLTHRQADYATIAFILNPYFITTLYYAGGISSILALAWQALSLLAVDRAAKEKHLPLPLLTVSAALMTLSHIPSTICFFTLSPVYAFFACEGPSLSKRCVFTVKILLSLCAGFCMSAFYWLPAIINHPFILAENFTHGKFDYSQNFYSEIYAYFVPNALIILGAAGIVFTISSLKKQNHVFRAPLFYGLMALCMASPLSLPLWKFIPVLPLLQFPFRFFIPCMLSVGISTLILSTSNERRAALSLLLFCGIVLNGLSANLALKQRYPNEKIYYSNDIILPPSDEYHTRWTPADIKTPQRIIEWADRPIIALLTGKATWQRDETGIITIVVESQNATIEYRQFYFPGQRLLIDNAFSPELLPSHNGLIQFSLPQGTHRLGKVQLFTQGTLAGGVVSGLVILVCIGLIYRQRRLKRHSSC